MLARAHRLRQTSDIKDTVRQGGKYNSSQLTVFVRPGQSKQTRIALVVGRAVHRSAVRRHRLRRWMAQVAGEALDNLFTGASYDMVWVARPAAEKIQSLEQLRKVLWPTLKRIT
jgi:ribonuclease P protein component